MNKNFPAKNGRVTFLHLLSFNILPSFIKILRAVIREKPSRTDYQPTNQPQPQAYPQLTLRTVALPLGKWLNVRKPRTSRLSNSLTSRLLHFSACPNCRLLDFQTFRVLDFLTFKPVDQTSENGQNFFFASLDHSKMHYCAIWMILHELVTLPKDGKHLVLSQYAISSRSNRPNSRKWSKTSFLGLWIIQKYIFVIFEWSSMSDIMARLLQVPGLPFVPGLPMVPFSFIHCRKSWERPLLMRLETLGRKWQILSFPTTFSALNWNKWSIFLLFCQNWRP